MNFQYFVVTRRLFVLTRDKDLRSENESSPRRRVTSVTALPNAVYGRPDRPGVGYITLETLSSLRRCPGTLRAGAAPKSLKSFKILRFLNFLNKFSIFRGDAPAFRTKT